MKRALMLIALLAGTAWGAAEDFTTWTLADDPYGRLTIEPNEVVADAVTRNTRTYHLKDWGADYWEDFTVTFQWTGDECSSTYSWLMPFAMLNYVGDWQANLGYRPIGVRWNRNSAGNHRLFLVSQGGTYTDTSADAATLTVDTLYHITIARDHDGGTYSSGQIVMTIYDDDGDGNPDSLIDTQTLNIPSGDGRAYRYSGVQLSRANNVGSDSTGGTVAFLEFTEGGEEPPTPEPPAKVTTPSPAHEATDVYPGTALTWAAASGATSYDVYFALATEEDINDFFIGNQGTRSYTPTLAYDTEYQWRIDSVNTEGTTTGDIWTFTTRAEPTAPPEGYFEDLTTYSLNDAKGLITVTDANHAVANGVSGDYTTWLSKDYGAGYFGGNLTAHWRSTWTNPSHRAPMTMFLLGNQETGWRQYQVTATHGEWVMWEPDATSPRVLLQAKGPAGTSSDSVSVQAQEEYWFTFERDWDYGTTGRIQVFICTGGHWGEPGATLIHTLSVNLQQKLAMRYVMALQNKSTAGAANLASCTLEYLDLGIPSETGEGGTGGEPGDPGANGPYYVSPIGSNDFPGTSEANAWRTLSFALANATLSVTQDENIIYLMPGNHGNLSVTSKTWSSTDWDSRWRIIAQDGAKIETVTIQGVQSAYLEWSGLDIERTSPHSPTSGLFFIRNSSHVRLYDSALAGWWEETYLTGYGVAVRTASAETASNIDVNNVTIDRVDRGVYVYGSGAQSGIEFANIVVTNWNGNVIGLDAGLGARDAYDPILFYKIEGTNRTLPVLAGSHGNGFMGRGDNYILDSCKFSSFGGSGGIRNYDHAYSEPVFSNIIIRNNIIHGNVATIAYFTALGENVEIVNNLFVSTRRDSSLAAWRYNGAVTVSTSPYEATPDVTFSNNVLVCYANIGDTTYITGDNNVVWSVLRDGSWRSTFLDTNDVVVVQGVDGPYTSGWSATSFEQAGNVFYGNGSFADYFPIYGVGDWYLPSDWSVWNIPATSVLVDAAKPSDAPALDTLGNARDESPDIGPFEYVVPGTTPPARARDPQPVNGATDVAAPVILSWGGIATNWDLYVGTSPTTLAYVGNQLSQSYDAYSFAGATTYYWRVDANNSEGLTTGLVWSFTTASTLPATPSNPSPANGATNVAVSRTLTWQSARASSYDIYIDDDYYTSTSSASVSVSLAYATSYTWRVIAVNSEGQTTGPTWSFTTATSPGDITDPGGPGGPSMPDLPSVGWRVQAPSSMQNRPDRATGRYQTPFEALQAVPFVRTGGETGSTVIDPDLFGYLEAIVIAAEGDDPQWTLTVTDAWGAVLFHADDLDMTAGVVRYDGQSLPFAGGLIVDIQALDTTEPVRVLFLVREAYTR